MSKGERGEIFSGRIDVVTISFRETRAGGAFELARRAGPPVRRYFKRHARLPDTHTGEHFILHPADILLAEDSDGWGCRDAEAEAAKFPPVKTPDIALAKPAKTSNTVISLCS